MKYIHVFTVVFFPVFFVVIFVLFFTGNTGLAGGIGIAVGLFATTMLILDEMGKKNDLDELKKNVADLKRELEEMKGKQL